VLSALRHNPHPSHATVQQAMGWARRIGARHTWLTTSPTSWPRRHQPGAPAGIALARRPDRPRDPMSDAAAPMIPVFCSAQEIPAGFGPAVAAIGNFDGVHRGHREILSAVVNEARDLGMRSVAITFDPHPEQFLRPAEAPRLLTPSPSGSGCWLHGHRCGPGAAFDAALAGLPARDFVRRILVAGATRLRRPRGRNFRFGHHAEAGVAELREFGAGFGFAVHQHSSVRVRGLEVSSSAIRALVAAGDVHRAHWMLGRPFAVRSTPARGRGIGTRLLVPTVNLAPMRNSSRPLASMSRASPSARAASAVTNVGNRPTFGRAVVCRGIAPPRFRAGRSGRENAD